MAGKGPAEQVVPARSKCGRCGRWVGTVYLVERVWVCGPAGCTAR